MLAYKSSENLKVKEGVMRKKIRVKIPKLVYDTILQDIEYMNLKRETMYNIILQELGFEKINEIGKEILNLDEKRQIAFNLNDMNTNLIEDMKKTQNFNTDGELIIKVFSTYANLHPAVRERVIRKDFFLRLETSIKEKIEVTIRYESNKIQKVLPLSFERDKEYEYNYLKVRVEKEEFLYEVRDITYIS